MRQSPRFYSIRCGKKKFAFAKLLGFSCFHPKGRITFLDACYPDTCVFHERRRIFIVDFRCSNLVYISRISEVRISSSGTYSMDVFKCSKVIAYWRDKPQQLAFAVRFLNRMTCHLPHHGVFFGSDEAHKTSHLSGTVNTQNCIWAKENSWCTMNFPYILQN